jgi:hypothetical protein
LRKWLKSHRVQTSIHHKTNSTIVGLSLNAEFAAPAAQPHIVK